MGKRRELERLRAQLEHDRSSFLESWRDQNDYIRPKSARFELSDHNRGEREDDLIVDSTATFASETLQSGMMSGITSPARPWFKLGSPQPELEENESVKEWLHKNTEAMSGVFTKSNLYNVLPDIYSNVGDYGTAGMAVFEDEKNVLHFESIPLGSFSIGNNSQGRVDKIAREFRMTVANIVDEFGRTNPNNPRFIDWSKISPMIRRMYENNRVNHWIDVVHVIRPNPDFRPASPLPKHKQVESVYYERSSGAGEDDRFLRESGFDFFPILVPRWRVIGNDVWGTMNPGVE